jgi:HEAT repeat protein
MPACPDRSVNQPRSISAAEIDQLIQKFRQDRLEAPEWCQFVEMGEPVVPQFLPLLQDKNPEVRLRAVNALGSISYSAKAAIPSLILLLKDPNKEVRSDAAGVIGSIGEAAIPSLMPLFKDPDKAVRSNAAEALGYMGKSAKNAIPSLIPLLKDPDKAVRSDAVDVLGEIGEAAIPSLMPLLKDPDNEVRSNAAFALERMGKSVKLDTPMQIDRSKYVYCPPTTPAPLKIRAKMFDRPPSKPSEYSATNPKFGFHPKIYRSADSGNSGAIVGIGGVARSRSLVGNESPA